MESIEENERNAVEVEVTRAMSRAEVVEEILRRVKVLKLENERLWGEHLTENI